MGDPAAVQELVVLLREHRESLEGRLGEERVRGRAEKQRGDKLMTRLEKMRDLLIGLAAALKKDHGKCMLRQCPACDALKEARKMLTEFRWD